MGEDSQDLELIGSINLKKVHLCISKSEMQVFWYDENEVF